MKPFTCLIFFALIIANTCFGQNATFDNLTIGNLTKSGGAAGISGWGESPDNTLDARPNFRTDAVPFMINHHTGLTLSAHSHYGGIRFYNQGYPNTYDQIGSTMVMSITNGNVGIRTANPSQPLTVPITSNAQGISLGTYSSLSAGQFAFVGITGADGTFNGGNLTGGDNGSTGIAIIHTNGGGGNSAELAFITHNLGADSRERLRIDRLGNVGIGTTTPNERLSVNGNIRAHEIKVETANWPDFVFAKSYQLPTLQQTEKHIQEKGHLPGIPSAVEVKANGIDLGEMNAKLLQKIEELTLHLIAKEKEIFDQNKRIEKLEDFNKKMVNQKSTQ